MFQVECRARKTTMGKGSEYGMLLDQQVTLDGKL